MVSQTEARRCAALAVALMACYAINLTVTVELREASTVTALWTANAFVMGALILLPRWWALGVALSCSVMQVLSTHQPGEGWSTPVLFAAMNLVEAGAVAWLVLRYGLVRLTTPGRVARLVGLMLPVLGVCAVIASYSSHTLLGTPLVDAFTQRLPAKMLGILMVLPGVLLLAKQNSMPFPKGRTGEAGGWFVLVAALSALLFTPFSSAALLLMFPAITGLGLRLGPRAVILSVLMSSAVVFPMGMAFAPGVMFDADWPLARQVLVMQIFMAAVFFTGLITALSSMHQERLRALFARRTASAMRSRDRAKAASRAKSEFLATMSHEIRTPLNSIIGFAQVLDRRTDLPGDAHRQIGLIERAGDALLTVVNDILDFSKVEAGELALDPKPVRLAAVAEDAIAIAAGAAERKGLALALETAGETAHSHVVDDHRLRQILLNYLYNAIKFTDTGAVRLTLQMAEGDGTDRARFTVSDTGPGISEEARGRLFRRFSQVDSSISRTHGGSGLGLAICKSLAELMGGEVGVESSPGAGSAFWVEFDLPRAAEAVALEEHEARSSGLGAHVLLVDDHPMNRELGQTVLGLLGCTCDVACDGLEAVEAARSRPYDAILMDVHMPGMDGLAATRAIRALPAPLCDVPIVAMSADVLPEHVERCRAAGMVEALGKPIDIQALHACLTRWCGREETAVEEAA